MQKHEHARDNCNNIYDIVSKMPYQPPTLENCVSFYNNVKVLENVTVPDDPIYYTYKRLLRVYIAETMHSISILL